MRTIVVTGMHRSGTSLVARLLNLAGLYLGRPDDLIGPKRDNPAGFWENRSIVKFNDELLALHDGSWDNPPVPPAGWTQDSRVVGLRERAQEILADVFPDNGKPARGWKDPRTSLLLPFWRSVTPIDGVILAVRDPEEVAASLERRNGLPSEDAASLWLRYNLAVLREPVNTHVVAYEDALANPAETMERLATFAGLPPPGAGTLAEARAFADPSARHHRAGQATANGPIMRIASAVYRSDIGQEQVAEAVLQVLATHAPSETVTKPELDPEEAVRAWIRQTPWRERAWVALPTRGRLLRRAGQRRLP